MLSFIAGLIVFMYSLRTVITYIRLKKALALEIYLTPVSSSTSISSAINFVLTSPNFLCVNPHLRNLIHFVITRWTLMFWSFRESSHTYDIYIEPLIHSNYYFKFFNDFHVKACWMTMALNKFNYNYYAWINN